MKPNESSADRVIRAILGTLALMIGYFVLKGTPQIIAYVVGVIMLLTGIIGFCGIYSLLGISTISKEKQN